MKQKENTKLEPKINVITQYIRDLSFENNAVQKDISIKETPSFKIDVKLNTKPKEENKYEVSLVLLVTASTKSDKIFILELDYAGIFEVLNIPKEQLHPFLMIECPRIIFPFARRIVFDITRDGGYPPINLDMIDFLHLYRTQAKQKNKN